MTHLSIVIPAYNEERRLPNTLRAVDSYISEQDYTTEVIVVVNGSTDNTLEVAQEFAAEHNYVRVLHDHKRGKGRAVRLGMIEALGKYRFMCDADLSMPIHEIV